MGSERHIELPLDFEADGRWTRSFDTWTWDPGAPNYQPGTLLYEYYVLREVVEHIVAIEGNPGGGCRHVDLTIAFVGERGLWRVATRIPARRGPEAVYGWGPTPRAAVTELSRVLEQKWDSYKKALALEAWLAKKHAAKAALSGQQDQASPPTEDGLDQSAEDEI